MMRKIQQLSAITLVALFLTGLVAWAQQPAATVTPAIPTVVLSKQHEAQCIVKVGDAFPALELATLTGTAQALPQLYGKPATVVLFWKGGGWMTRAALRDLGRDIGDSFGKQGVAVVTVAVGQPADATQATLDKSESKLTTLFDPEGKAFAQIGSATLPRVFVLDGTGKVVWFDLEYSNSTRRELTQAVQKLVGP